ncbi:MAG: ATP-binding protein [Bdellovibrionota bacterium]|jgi:two-component system nitrogen regulation sensor histidine kinase NtrY
MVSRGKRVRLLWRRTGLLRIAVLVSSAVILALLMYCLRETDSNFMGTNLLVVAVVNLNIIALGVMGFLIGRNIVKLVFDRKNNVLGARLRSRLVLAFVGLTLVPTIIVFVLASMMMTNAMDRWFSTPTEDLHDSAVGVAKLHYEFISKSLTGLAAEVSEEISKKPLIYREKTVLYDFLENARKKNKLFSLSIFTSDGRKVISAHNAAATISDLSEPIPNQDAINQALGGEPLDALEPPDSKKFIRVYYLVKLAGDNDVLIATYRLNPQLMNMLTVIDDSYREHEQLKLFHRPLQSGYILTLAMVTAIILFAAIWVGFYIAREITGPVQRLAEGTKAVARGNYDFKLRETGDDEISFLVKSFNKMTADLKQSRIEIETRKLYLESILAKLAVAVIALDMDGNVTSLNQAALKLFGVNENSDNYNLQLSEILSPTDLLQIEALLRCIDSVSTNVSATEREMGISNNGRLRKVVATVGPIADNAGNRLGSVLLFDDVTELVMAQQSAAWREVARRIAHEIKNPLTPIQLSAQRLQKLFKEGEFEASVMESTQTILEHVGSIKRLTDEFAKFARMPPVEMEEINLNTLISDVLNGFVDQHPEAIFQFIADNTIPQIPLDREQIRRVLINLLDNGLSACSADEATMKRGCPRLVVKTGYNIERDIVTLEVADNGPGIPKSQRSKIFEPYVTTKEKGTGLGLAIVASILAEHHAEIKVFDNYPNGTRFVVELRTHSGSETLRRLS